MADLNKRFMGADGPTDVLAFPLDDPIDAGRWPDSGSTGPDREPPEVAELPMLLGDVVVCPAVAARQAPEHAGSYDDELALLVVHGVLHVLGMDHADPEEAAAMQARERELLDRYHRRALMVLAVDARRTADWADPRRHRVPVPAARSSSPWPRRRSPACRRPRPRRWPRRADGAARCCCRSWRTRSGSTRRCSSCCPPSSCSRRSSASWPAGCSAAWGVVGATVLNVTLFFVVAEVAPKTWAIQHTDRAALAAARPIKALAGWGPLRLLSRGLIGLTNVILPGKGLKRGPYTSEEELLAVADLAVEDAVIEAEERRAHRVGHRAGRHGRPRGDGAAHRHGHRHRATSGSPTPWRS